MATRFEKHFCEECFCIHWVEVVRQSTGWKEICHGKNYFPREDATHYTSSKGGAITLYEKTPDIQAIKEWAIAQEKFEDDMVAGRDW